MMDGRPDMDENEEDLRSKQHYDDLEESKDDIRTMKENINNRSFRDDQHLEVIS
jgi:hypothetical protein